MKLVITQSNLTLFGGAERIMLKVAQHYDAKIYTAEYNPKTTFPEFRDLDVEVIGSTSIGKILPYGRVAQGLNYGLTFYNFKIKDDYDVINPHMAPSHWIRNKNERVVWYCHTPLRDVYDLYRYRLAMKKPHQRPVYMFGANVVRAIDKPLVKKIEYIFANSANTKSRVTEYYHREAEVLNGGIDYQLYKNNGAEKYFFYPSRISPNKRQDYAIRAFSIFKRKKKGYKLVIVGAVSKDKAYNSYYNEVVKLARQVGDVQILESVSEKRNRELYSKCAAVLYTPINEDYGLVPLEGMAAGKPVIAVNEGGPKDTLVEGKTGYLVDSESDMAERMLYVMEHEKLAEDIGKNGQKRIKEHYSWPRFFKVFDQRIRKVARM